MLLDTSGLFCLHHVREPQHDEAVRLFQAARDRITHSYVLAEFSALADARNLTREPVLAYLVDLQDSRDVQVIYVEESLHREALNFLRERLDKRWSLCDAVSFILMQRRDIQDALTTDHHFEQAGFRRLLMP